MRACVSAGLSGPEVLFIMLNAVALEDEAKLLLVGSCFVSGALASHIVDGGCQRGSADGKGAVAILPTKRFQLWKSLTNPPRRATFEQLDCLADDACWRNGQHEVQMIVEATHFQRCH